MTKTTKVLSSVWAASALTVILFITSYATHTGVFGFGFISGVVVANSFRIRANRRFFRKAGLQEKDIA